jgi:two-component system chemotaxis response regulator CheB
MNSEYCMTEKTTLTCPECSGALDEIHEGDIVRFRCPDGHEYDLGTLVEEVSKGVESALGLSLNKIEEFEELLNRLTTQLDDASPKDAAAMVKQQIEIARQKADHVRQAARLEMPGQI